MNRVILSILLTVTAASRAHVIAPLAQPGYIAPGATAYIYRSDNNGPASLIQLGGPHYKQPNAFAPPIPLAAQPLLIEPQPGYNLAPAPLPYIAAQPIVVEDAEEDDDDSEESSDDYLDGGELIGHSHNFEKGAGSDYEEENHAAHGGKDIKSYQSNDHHAKGSSGHYGKEHKEGHHKEAKGGKASHYDQADAHGQHHESSKGYKVGDHGHKKHFSKGEDITGYHKIFHKDEFKKDHDFYDVADKSGHFNKHGYEKGQHGSEEGSYKKAGRQDGGYAKQGFGKAGFHAKGHHNESDAGHSVEEGEDSHYNHAEDYGKKGGAAKEKEYAFDNHEDDYEDEE